MRNIATMLLLSGSVLWGAVSVAGAAEPNTVHYELKLKSENFGDMGTRKMWIKGNNFRWEAKSERLPLCLVKNKDGVYLVHPWNKYAAKYSEDSSRSNPKMLFPGPTGSIKTFLKHVKAKKHGVETVNKEKCDVYTYKNPASKHPIKIWVNAKTDKPIKLFIKGEKGKADSVTATYTKFEAGAKVPDSTFELPKGYVVRPMPKKDITSKTKPKKPMKLRSG